MFEILLARVKIEITVTFISCVYRMCVCVCVYVFP